MMILLTVRTFISHCHYGKGEVRYCLMMIPDRPSGHSALNTNSPFPYREVG